MGGKRKQQGPNSLGLQYNQGIYMIQAECDKYKYAVGDQETMLVLYLEKIAEVGEIWRQPPWKDLTNGLFISPY